MSSAAPGMRRGYGHEAARASMLCALASGQRPMLMLEWLQSAIGKSVIAAKGASAVSEPMGRKGAVAPAERKVAAITPVEHKAAPGRGRSVRH